MKEATGELSSLLVVASSVAILVAFFLTVIWPLIDDNFKRQTSCDKAVCSKEVHDGYVNCTLDGKTTFTCPYKG